MKGSLEANYAEALFELCKERDNLDEVHSELLWLSEVVEKNNELIKFLNAPTVEPDDKKNVLKNVFEGCLSNTSFDFLCVVADKKRIRYLQKIIESFNALYNEENNILEVTAITTVPLSDTLREKLIAKLESVSKKTIVLSEKIDKSIIGGIVLEYSNTQIQGSIKHRLDELRARINSVIA